MRTAANSRHAAYPTRAEYSVEITMPGADRCGRKGYSRRGNNNNNNRNVRPQCLFR